MATKEETTAASTGDWWDATDTGEWDEVVADSGEPIVLDGSPDKPFVFVGKVIAIGEQTVMNKDTGEIRPVPQIVFEDQRGDRRNLFANYAINEALSKGVKIGSVVRITHFGLRKLTGEKSGRTVNRMSVEVKK
ncbi:MAG: hypothetical protein ACREHG_04325 [Candidatus Saccharimonadales bacterium]